MHHVIVLIGPPGSGKGTQGQLLANTLEIPALSTGEILRREVASGTALGREVSSVLDGGGLVSDDLMNRVVAERFAKADCMGGFILDGYPRTVEQARFLDTLGLEVDVLWFEADEHTLLSRLMARRFCPLCGRVYNLDYQPPAHDGFCDDDGMLLVRRKDDAPEVIAQRLRTYADATAPLLAHYRGHGLHRVDATQQPERVHDDLICRLTLRAVA